MVAVDRSVDAVRQVPSLLPGADVVVVSVRLVAQPIQLVPGVFLGLVSLVSLVQAAPAAASVPQDQSRQPEARGNVASAQQENDRILLAPSVFPKTVDLDSFSHLVGKHARNAPRDLLPPNPADVVVARNVQQPRPRIQRVPSVSRGNASRSVVNAERVEAHEQENAAKVSIVTVFPEPVVLNYAFVARQSPSAPRRGGFAMKAWIVARGAPARSTMVSRSASKVA